MFFYHLFIYLFIQSFNYLFIYLFNHLFHFPTGGVHVLRCTGGAAAAPGAAAFDSWSSKELDSELGGSRAALYSRPLGGGVGGGFEQRDRAVGGSSSSVGRRSRGDRMYTLQHLEDLREMMMFKLKVGIASL